MRGRIGWVASLMISVLLSCLAHVSHSQTDETGNVRFYRPKDLFCSALKAKIVVDDTTTFHLANGETSELVLSTGKHRIRTRRSSIEIDVNAGTTNQVRTFFEFNFLFGRAMVVEVSHASALAEADRLRRTE